MIGAAANAAPVAPAGTWNSGPGKNRDKLLTTAHTILGNAGVAMSPSRVRRLVQTYERTAAGNSFSFADFLATTAQLDADRRRSALADPGVARAISWADPTGEKAVRNVVSERGW